LRLLSLVLLGEGFLFFLHNCSVWLYILMLHIDAGQEKLIIWVLYGNIFSFDCLSLVYLVLERYLCFSTAKPHRIGLRLLLLALRVNDLKLVHCYIIRLLRLTLMLKLILVVLLLLLSNGCKFGRHFLFLTSTTIIIWLSQLLIGRTLPAISRSLVGQVLNIACITGVLTNLFLIDCAVWFARCHFCLIRAFHLF